MKRLSLAIVGLVVCSFLGCGGSSGDNSTASNTSGPPTPMMPPGPSSMPAPGMSAPMPGATMPMPGVDGSQGPPPGMTAPMPGAMTPMPGVGGSQGPPPGMTAPMPGATTPMPGVPMPGGGSAQGPPPGMTAPMPGVAGSQGPLPGETTPMPGVTTPPMPGVNGADSQIPMPGAPMPGGQLGYGPPGSATTQPKTLSERADEAFRKGSDREAFQLLYAAALVNEEEAEKLPEQFRWIASLKKPALAVRWGIGIEYNPPKGYTGHPSPVGYTPPDPATNNMGAPGAGPVPGGAPNGGQKPRRKVFGQRDRNSQPGGAPNQPAEKPPASHPPADPTGFLEYYTGEVGTKVVEELTKRITDGNYGPVLQQAMESFESGPAPANNAGYPGTFPGAPMIPGGAMIPGGPMVPGGPGNNNAKPEEFKPGSIVPGVVLLGEGGESELLRTATEHDVHFLILFEVTVRKSNRDATNNTKFRVISLDKAKLPAAETTAEGEKPREIFISSTINNHRVESAREKNDDDPLTAEIDGFTQAIDGEVTVVPLAEKVNSEAIALKRATYLAAQSENQLANLVEIRQYQVAKLITDEQAAELFIKVLGKDKAEKLLNGKTEADRAAALRTWLPKA